jgi:hypothetical protein
MDAWDQGAEVQDSSRRSRFDPYPALLWVEGDQPHLRWNGMTMFLNQLEYDAGRSPRASHDLPVRTLSHDPRSARSETMPVRIRV